MVLNQAREIRGDSVVLNHRLVDTLSTHQGSQELQVVEQVATSGLTLHLGHMAPHSAVRALVDLVLEWAVWGTFLI